MVSIRKYEEKDREDVHFVNHNSDGPEEVPNYLTGLFYLNTFCNYYIEHEPENCFVLDDDGRAVGYILCAENFDRFKEIFDSEYLPRSDSYGEDRYEWASTAYLRQEEFKEDYPAHFHVDILPEYQRMGMGGKMVDTLCAHLKQKGVKGVCLTCGPRNEKAMKFYEKHNFTLLSIDHDDACFGKKLTD